MRLLLSLLIVIALCLPALADIHYVNAGCTAARNLNSVGYGTTSGYDSPYITPSYAVAQMVSGDTMMIYGYSQTDSSYYMDIITTTNIIFIIGVSVGIDSPTFWGGNKNYTMLFDGVLVKIEGIRFKDISNYRHIYWNNPPNNSVGIINNCIFDSQPLNSPVGTLYHQGSAINVVCNSGTPFNLYVNNSVFNYQKQPCVTLSAQGSTIKLYAYINSCQFNDDSYVIGAYTASDALTDSSSFFISNSTINADTLFLASANPTHGQIEGNSNTYTLDSLITNNFSSVYTIKGFSGETTTSTLRYTQPFITRWRPVLWRGR
jgi:hypothetical protein